MSVVVTCTTSGPGLRHVPASRSAPGSATRRNESSSAMPPATLRSKYRIPSLTWIGERARRYGSVAADPAVPVRVHARAGERRRAEALAHERARPRACRPRPSGTRSRPRPGRGARRSGRSTGRARRPRRRRRCGRAGGACACAIRRRRARSRTRRAAPPTRPAAPPPGNEPPLLDEVGREVERRRARRCRTRIGSATSTKSAVPSSKVTTTDGASAPASTAPRAARARRRATTAPRRRDRGDLLVEARGVEVDLERRRRRRPGGTAGSRRRRRGGRTRSAAADATFTVRRRTVLDAATREFGSADLGELALVVVVLAGASPSRGTAST